MMIPFVDIHTHTPPLEAITITSYGIHPWRAEEVILPLVISDFEGYDAVGEVGLDLYSSVCREQQLRVLRAQLEIAQQLGKIVVIHCVRGYNEILAELKSYSLRVVIFHGFIGSVQLMEQLTSCGYYLSFGERTFGSPKTIAALLRTPIERLFVESDESGVEIADIYCRVAKILGIEVLELRDIVYKNYKNIKR